MPQSTAPTIKLYGLHDGQQQVLREAKQHNVLVCGRRWRKTTLCQNIAVQDAIQGKTIVWGSPTNFQAKYVLDQTEKRLNGYGEINHTDKIIRFPSGGEIYFKGLEEYNNIRTMGVDGIIVDEAAFCAEEAFNDVLEPMISDRGGYSWLISTPNGMNWFYDAYKNALSQPDHAAWNAPLIGCEVTENGLIRKRHELERFEDQYVNFEFMKRKFNSKPLNSFRAEYLAEFIINSGSVLVNVSDAVDKGRELPEEPKRDRSYILGVDLGRFNDYSVLTVLESETNGKSRQVYLQRMQCTDWETQKQHIIRTAIRYNATIIIDSSGAGQAPYEDLSRRCKMPVIGHTFSNTFKLKMIGRLQLSFEKRRLRLMDNTIQEKELLAYEYDRTPKGAITMGAPKNKHDDIVNALALANYHVFKRQSEPIRTENNPFYENAFCGV